MTITDQIGREIYLAQPPKRIVCCVPSLTEFLFDLGLEEEIVGITKYCIHPASKVKKKTTIGGTKKLNSAAILALKPDLIIANKEENKQTQIDDLAIHFPVYVSEIKDFNSALEALSAIGEITGKASTAIQIVSSIQEQYEQFQKPAKSLDVAYLIWRKPYMTCGGDTYISDLLAKAGYNNVFKNKLRYPQIETEELIKANPQLILLSSEPYPFNQKHFDALYEETGIPVAFVDGEKFSWYGSKMLFAFAYFEKLSEAVHEAYNFE